jgi:hypothetical protein
MDNVELSYSLFIDETVSLEIEYLQVIVPSNRAITHTHTHTLSLDFYFRNCAFAIHSGRVHLFCSVLVLVPITSRYEYPWITVLDHSRLYLPRLLLAGTHPGQDALGKR